MPDKKAERAEHDAHQAEEAPAVVATEQAVPADAVANPPVPPLPPVPPIAPTPAVLPAPDAAVRAHFKGNPGEYLSPLLVAERAEDGTITERIYYTPARALTDEEWRAMPAVHRDYVRAANRLYDVASDAQVRAARAERKAASE